MANFPPGFTSKVFERRTIHHAGNSIDFEGVYLLRPVYPVLGVAFMVENAM